MNLEPVLPADVFSQLSWLPDPVYSSASNKYLPFQDVYGSEPTEKDRPSLPIASDSQHASLLVSTKAQCTVTCCMCSKLRVVYSPSQLSSSAIQFVEGVAKDYLYLCGSNLPSVCETEDLPVVREGINCNSPVDFAYYSSKKFKYVCALCGSDNDCTIDDDLKKEFQTVLPLCRDCVSSHKQPITRGKFRSKRKASERCSHAGKRQKN